MLICNIDEKCGRVGSILLCIVLFLLLSTVDGYGRDNIISDSIPSGTRHFTHRIAIDFGNATVLNTPNFYSDENGGRMDLQHALSGHLKYSFALPAATLGSKVFAETYQGIGLGYYNFHNNKELGAPLLAYVFQRSRIAKLFSNASIVYEWNFGISTGWKPYDHYKNPNNVIIGSKINAYLNMGVYLNWEVNHWLTMSGGGEFTHFSNGNTQYPNAGLNTTGYRIGAIYDINPEKKPFRRKKEVLVVPKFPHHLSYDVVLFGSWRKKGVKFLDQQVASPDTYPVVGAYFAPMYNFGYRFRAGVSLDAIYDGSANVYTEDYILGTEQKFFKPKFNRQIALGASIRGEYVMPVFTISAGIGANVLHKGGDLKGLYQSLALKVKTGKSSYLHIGYNLKDFNEPNYLMLGVGYRFRNRTPSLLRD